MLYKQKRQNEYKHQAFENSSSLTIPFSVFLQGAPSGCSGCFSPHRFALGRETACCFPPMHIRNLELGSLTISLPPVVNRHLKCFSKEQRSKVMAEDISSFSKDCQSVTRQNCSPSLSKEIFPSRSAEIRAGALPANSP